MGDVEEVVEKEAFPEVDAEYEDEYTDFKSQLRALVLSIARQLYCSCSVMMFPVLSQIYQHVKRETPPIEVDLDPDDKYFSIDEEHFAFIVFDRGLLTPSITGFIIGGILLRFIGRKYTIILTNFLHVVLLSYAFLSGVEEFYPYNLSLVNVFVRNIGYMSFFIYLAEITSPTFRAFFMGFYVLNENIARIKVDTARNEGKVNKMFRNVTVITSLSFLLAIFTPETPFWLTLKGNPEKAEEIFTWIRAGYSDVDEFNQMLSTIEDYSGDKRILKRILSRTFIVGFIFSILVILCDINPCKLMEVVLHDNYLDYDTQTQDDIDNLALIIDEPSKYFTRNKMNGVVFFLAFNFILPRKLFYVMSYSLGILIVVVIRYNLSSIETLMQFSSYCLMPPYLGTTALQHILAVEMFPTTLREIGLVARSIFNVFYLYADDFSTSPDGYFPLRWINRPLYYAQFFISLIGIPVLLIFMPETKTTNIYELDQVISDLPGEDFTSVDGENAVGESEEN
ncbi:hypothetical protein V9T40_011561 [Parthenolecanium corni]|uniref:Uncharacterized protein n=1 Tax=Parthenolecanium corni TaxID=536013 RepID=A0AAN9T826_9HEMI